VKIVIPETMHADAVEFLKARYDTVYDPSLVRQPERFRALLADADAIIVRKGTAVTRQLLEAAPRLKAAGRLGVGLDHFDLPACAEHHVKVINAPGANEQSVAEYVIATAMLLLRWPSFTSTEETLSGHWNREQYFHDRELGGKTLGVIGFGRIGKLTSRLAGLLGMRVVAHDPFVPDTDPAWHELNVKQCSLDTVLQEADVLTLHVPLEEGTRNLLNRERIGRLKRGAIVIQAARGGVIDDAALAAALQSGHLGGAAVDVFVEEPPAAHSVYGGVPNLIATQHIAGVTAESEARVARYVAERVAQHLEASKGTTA
jgi:(S)-sulfolactate dehydrogenase